MTTNSDRLQERLEELVDWTEPVGEEDVRFNLLEPQPWNGGTKVDAKARGRRHWLFVHRWPDRHEDFKAEVTKKINEERALSLNVGELATVLPLLLAEINKLQAEKAETLEVLRRFKKLVLCPDLHHLGLFITWWNFWGNVLLDKLMSPTAKPSPPASVSPQNEAQDLSTLPEETPDACRPPTKPWTLPPCSGCWTPQGCAPGYCAGPKPYWQP